MRHEYPLILLILYFRTSYLHADDKNSVSKAITNDQHSFLEHLAFISASEKLLSLPPGCDLWFPRPGSNSSEWRPSEAEQLKSVMLFDIEKDPEERVEVSAEFPAVVDYLLGRLNQHQKSAAPINFPDDDPKCDPGPTGAWGPWA